MKLFCITKDTKYRIIKILGIKLRFRSKYRAYNTYLQIGPKNYYPCVVLDWASREVLGWSLSDNMNTQLCLEALDMAFSNGRKPEIFNTDQGSQYTSHDWLRELEERGISISMDGKGRWADNIAVERFWRTYKHDSFLLNEVNTLEEARRLTAHWLTYYNRERPHARLGNLSPSEYCRQKGYPPGGEFFARFFRSDAARVAPLRALATLGTLHLRYKIAQKMD